MKPSRPLTHDLFKSFADSFHIQVIEVTITKFVEGVFHSTLICKKENDILNLDARTSDAVALALRFECPIFAEEEVIEKTAIELDEQHQEFVDDEEDEDDDDIFDEEESTAFKFTKDESEINVKSFEKLNAKELEEILLHYIETEQYELASKVRDEIKSRKK
jgi:bifunctional DNase/RNase